MNIINMNCNKIEGTQGTYHDKFEASVLIDLDQLCFPHLESFRTIKRGKSSASIWVEELWSRGMEAPTVRWWLGWVEDEQ